MRALWFVALDVVNATIHTPENNVSVKLRYKGVFCVNLPRVCGLP